MISFSKLDWLKNFATPADRAKAIPERMAFAGAVAARLIRLAMDWPSARSPNRNAVNASRLDVIGCAMPGLTQVFGLGS
jgi:hypothetical protein